MGVVAVMSKSKIQNYRADLDGVRAVAVLAVLIYHAGVTLNAQPLLPGGFLGVDVFFVLSGFFISSIIFREIKESRFSYVRFYIRRAKRILPAITLVILFCLVCMYFIFLPSQNKTAAGSALSAMFFSSNLFFAFGEPYGADPSRLKPLLHTWSLAVEEQFYFVFPTILSLMFFSKNVKALFCAMLALTLMSLGFAHWFSAVNSTYSFFLLPSRFWEMSAGALIAISLVNQRDYTRSLCEIMTVLGLALAIIPMFLFGKETHHPSLLTAIPVLGTCLIIIFSRTSVVARIILANSLMVWIGLLSYSLYVWHWPIIVFFSNQMEILNPLQILIVSFALAALSYYFFEKPLRYSKTKTTLSMIVILYALAGSVAAYVWFHSSSFGRYANLGSNVAEFNDPEFRKLKQVPFGNNYTNSFKGTQENCISRTPETACSFGNEKYILLGDSLVGSLDRTWSQKFNLNKHGFISLTVEQCSFLDPSIWPEGLPLCTVANEDRIAYIEALEEKKIFVLTAHYKRLVNANLAVSNPIEATKSKTFKRNPVGKNEALRLYKKQIQFLLDQGHTVVQIGSFIEPGKNFNLDYAQAVQEDRLFEFAERFGTRAMVEEALQKDLDMAHNDPRVIFISPTLLLCDPNVETDNCLGADLLGPKFVAGNHPSTVFAEEIIHEILLRVKGNPPSYED